MKFVFLFVLVFLSSCDCFYRYEPIDKQNFDYKVSYQLPRYYSDTNTIKLEANHEISLSDTKILLYNLIDEKKEEIKFYKRDGNYFYFGSNFSDIPDSLYLKIYFSDSLKKEFILLKNEDCRFKPVLH